MGTKGRQYEASDSEWEMVKDYLSPERTGKAGRPSGENRKALNGTVGAMAGFAGTIWVMEHIVR